MGTSKSKKQPTPARPTGRVAGRRAKEAKYSAGQSGGYMLIPTATNVPRQTILPPCAGRCGRGTRNEPDADGKAWCSRCRPYRYPKLKKRVDRKCVRCDGRVSKSLDAEGPFFCGRCKRRLRQDADMKGYHTGGGDGGGGHVDPPGTDERIAALSAMYSAVAAHGSERSAKAAGVPTTLNEFHAILPDWREHGHAATADRARDDEEEEEDFPD